MMNSAVRLWKKLVTFSFLLLLFLSLAGVFAPLLNPEKVPFIQLIPAILVFFIPLQLLAILYFRKRKRWLSLIFLAVALASFWSGVQDWNWSHQHHADGPSLRVVSYNTRNFNFTGKTVDSVINLLKPLDPDVICFQEFRNYRIEENGPRATQVISNKMDMPHYKHFRTGKYFQGIAIFSRYPIVKLDTLFMDEEEANNGLLATIQAPGQEVGIGNFHLSSFQFFSIKKEENTLPQQIKRLLVNSNQIIPLHLRHTREVLETTRDYPHPLILSADLNTVPHSYVVRQIRQHFRDSFREKGTGLGWTYPLWENIGVRIDYQFVSPEVKVLSHRVIRAGPSDHYPLLCVYQLPEINSPELSR